MSERSKVFSFMVSFHDDGGSLGSVILMFEIRLLIEVTHINVRDNVTLSPDNDPGCTILSRLIKQFREGEPVIIFGHPVQISGATERVAHT